MSVNDIKSSAVVKYTAVNRLAQFRQLQADTDLNQPPSNWLHGHSKAEETYRNLSFGKHQFFSSFKIGNCYPELTGEVDVVSDAENIKKLLKMPYSNGPVSMMVHRIGNTLLLDEFDVHKHLLRQQQKDWRWLRKFYYDTIVQNMHSSIKDRMPVMKKNKSRDHLQNLNLLSKFLYYSIDESNNTSSNECETYESEASNALRTTFDTLPDPMAQSEDIQPEQQRTFHWTFEDIRMLIGTDLPIFGGHTHPCISLRLRDRRNPINVLTGLDYWLDNLMCNVPEMAMCYHLDGIVQSYEVIKTEDIPTLSDSEFSPDVVKEIAQNILSFLKSNATKEGHTYWLFKGTNDDIVKLYDLTTLCADTMEDGANPFTVPVGMLLYRVARNMMQTSGIRKSATIRTLLQKCLLLLDSNIYPQVVISAQLLLSDLYVSDDLSTQRSDSSTGSTQSPDTSMGSTHSPDTSTGSTQRHSSTTGSTQSPDAILDESDAEDVPDQHESNDDIRSTTTIDVHTLSSPESVRHDDLVMKDSVRYPPILINLEQRCQQALRHIAEALQCLDESIIKCGQTEHSSQKKKSSVQEHARCNPSQPIPLPYESIKTTNSEKSTKNLLVSEQDMAVRKSGSLWFGSAWQRQSKLLLVRKAAIILCLLAECSTDRCGLAWKYLRLALHSCNAMEALGSKMAGYSVDVLCRVLSNYGDVHLVIARHDDITDILSDATLITDTEEIILTSIQQEISLNDDEWLLPLTLNARHNMEKSSQCYKTALDCCEQAQSSSSNDMTSLVKRYGNILNELGVHYMNETDILLAESEFSMQPLKDLWELSKNSFHRALQQFTKLDDGLNSALVHSNLGRLNRLCAKVVGRRYESDQSQCQFTPEEAQFFTKAQDSYKQALELLVSRESQPEVWDSISWELSSTYFTMARLLQDYAPLTTKAQEQVEKEVVKLMEKSLGLCRLLGEQNRPAEHVYRAATIHHRLASLYHNTYRNQVDDKRLKTLRSHSETNYKLSAELFKEVESPCEFIRVQLERVALHEYHLSNQTSALKKMRSLVAALDDLQDCQWALKMLHHQTTDHTITNQHLESLVQESSKLINIYISRIQFVTRSLVKLSLSKNKTQTAEHDKYKKMYSIVLSGTVFKLTNVNEQCLQLSTMLLELSSI